MSDWITIQPSLDPILAPVNVVIETIDAVLGALIAILNIVQTILNIIKAFLLGLLDPLKIIIKAIIAEIRAIIADLKQLGFYVHAGDIDLVDVKNNFRDLRGGFNAFERRCVSRLVDKRDLLRPDFSSSSAALGLFVYVSGQDVDLIIRTLTAIYNFLTGKNKPTQAAFLQPASLSVIYGDTPLASFKEFGGAMAGKNPIQKAIVKWTMPPGPGPGAGFKVPAPKGWIIEISTVEGGLKVVSTAPDDANSSSLYPSQLSAVAIDPVTNGVLEAYGGADMVGSGSTTYSDVWPAKPSDPRAVKLWFQKDTNTPLIPPLAISKAKGGPYFGNAFFVKNDAVKMAMPGQSFRAVFDASMLPKDADVEQDPGGSFDLKITPKDASSYFVRVRAVGKSVVESFSGGTDTSPLSLSDEELRLYKFTSDNVRQAKSGRLFPSVPSDTISASDWGIASAPVEMAFPSESSQEYIEAIQLALIVMVLSRSDVMGVTDLTKYVEGRTAGATGLEEIAAKLFPQMQIKGNKYFGTGNPVEFSKNLRKKTEAYAATLYGMASLSETLMASVVELAEPLFKYTWDKSNIIYGGSQAPAMTIAQTFGLGTESYVGQTPSEILNDASIGCAANPFAFSLDIQPELGFYYYDNSTGGPDRNPGFLEAPTPATSVKWEAGNGSLDYTAPVIYQVDNNEDEVVYVQFVRNLILANTELMGSAASVLKVTAAVRAPGDGSWMVYRPLYEQMAPLDQILTKVEDWLLALLSAADGIIEQIVAYIEAIQARVYQLQALIEMIRALLKQLDFALPSASALVVVGNGTDGVLKDFITAGNKPSDDPQSIGAGLILMTGGLPNILLDLLASLFAPVDEVDA